MLLHQADHKTNKKDTHNHMDMYTDRQNNIITIVLSLHSNLSKTLQTRLARGSDIPFDPGIVKNDPWNIYLKLVEPPWLTITKFQNELHHKSRETLPYTMTDIQVKSFSTIKPLATGISNTWMILCLVWLQYREVWCQL